MGLAPCAGEIPLLPAARRGQWVAAGLAVHPRAAAPVTGLRAQVLWPDAAVSSPETIFILVFRSHFHRVQRGSPDL